MRADPLQLVRRLKPPDSRSSRSQWHHPSLDRISPHRKSRIAAALRGPGWKLPVFSRFADQDEEFNKAGPGSALASANVNGRTAARPIIFISGVQIDVGQ